MKEIHSEKTERQRGVHVNETIAMENGWDEDTYKKVKWHPKIVCCKGWAGM